MNMPRFTAEESLYATGEHYFFTGLSSPGKLGSVVGQSLFCSQLGQKCGGTDLVCCPGLRCSPDGRCPELLACGTCSIVLHAGPP